jgi:hypothetical protein
MRIHSVFNRLDLKEDAFIIYVHVLLMIKGKACPRTGHEGAEGEKGYGCTLSLILVVDRGGWLTPRPGRFTPGKETQYIFCRGLGGPQGQSGRVQKIASKLEFNPRLSS